MVHCEMCDKDVEKFKSNSHVIPRCLFKNIKEKNGQFILIDNLKQVNKLEQREFKGNFICDICETNTAHSDDKFADIFFNQNKFLLSKIIINNHFDDLSELKGRIKSIEFFNNEAFINFKLFIISIILRYHCYLKKYKNKDLLPMTFFSELRDLYHNKDENNLHSKYPILIWKENELNNLLSYPSHRKINGINSKDIFILGYRIHIIIDKRHIVPMDYKKFEISNYDFKCFVHEGLTQFHLSLWDNISSNKMLGKLNNKNFQR